MSLIALYYAAIAFGLTVYTCNWHYVNRSPASHIIHDALVAWVWPLVIIERIRSRRG